MMSIKWELMAVQCRKVVNRKQSWLKPMRPTKFPITYLTKTVVDNNGSLYEPRLRKIKSLTQNSQVSIFL